MNPLPPALQSFLRPDFYPHPVEGEVQLLQTHISYVFLTGSFVYKIKKAVNFGFLDYSTLERRRHFCAEEMRLNQRGAKDLYLAVLPITQEPEGYALNGSGEVVEYALKMVQFPQENLLSNMFTLGTITPERMIELGQVVAEFHRVAQTNDYIRSFGEIPRIWQAINDNYRQTEKYIGIVQTPEQYQATRAFTDRFFAQHAAAFTQRIQGHFIRECHGDLHLGNVCLWQNRVQLFDCIEFNEPFRFVDTMYDVAFVVMDLTARGRTDLGNVFLNTYLEQTGDWEGLEVLPLYLSRQAYVRAKVTSLLLDDQAITTTEHQAAHQAATDYYKLAWNYTERPKGQLILMAGLSGSGKSTLARNIAQQTNGIYLRSDAIRKHLGGIGLLEKGPAELYTPDMTTQTYARLQTLGINLARQGYTVILDAKFDRQAHRNPVLQAALDLPIRIIHCQAPLAVLSQRLQQRTGDIADATADLLASQQAAWEDFSSTETAIVTTIDTTQDFTAFLQQL